MSRRASDGAAGDAHADERIEAIRQRCEAATAGPRELFGSTVVNWHNHAFDIEWMPNGDQEKERENGEFIAHAREDVPFLLARVSALTDQVASLRSVLAPLQELATKIDTGPWEKRRGAAGYFDLRGVFLGRDYAVADRLIGDEADFVLALVNALPALSSALASEPSSAKPTEPDGGARG